MRRVLQLLPFLVVVVVVVAGASCSTFEGKTEGEIWTIELFSSSKEPLGVVKIEVTSAAPGRSCMELAPGPRRLGRVLERPTLSGPQIEDSAILSVDGESFDINLSPSMCDSNVVLNGKRVGDQADGDLYFQRMPGYENMGSFHAQRRGPAV
jgi:hypothetical protein